MCYKTCWDCVFQEMKQDWGGERNDSIYTADDDEMERSTPRRTKYKDVADAAQAAFESAAYAAAAARAAVELSRSESGDSSHLRPRNVTDPIKPKFDEDIHEHIETTTRVKFEKKDSELKRTFSSSSSDSSDDDVKEATRIYSADSGKVNQGNVVFDESDGNDDVEGRNRAEFGGKMGDEMEPLNITRTPISVRGRWAQRR